MGLIELLLKLIFLPIYLPWKGYSELHKAKYRVHRMQVQQEAMARRKAARRRRA
jgi:hypothetical protein